MFSLTQGLTKVTQQIYTIEYLLIVICLNCHMQKKGMREESAWRSG